MPVLKTAVFCNQQETQVNELIQPELIFIIFILIFSYSLLISDIDKDADKELLICGTAN